MAIPKVCGIETEYGIISRGFDSNPIVASSVLVNAYSGQFVAAVGWDFVDETPGIDARGFHLEDSFPPEVETHLVNTVLTNGARYYVDHAHPEISTPECATAREVVLYDRAGEEIIRESMKNASAALPNGHEILTYKNNSDGKGNSYGCHENYLVDRDLPFGKLAAHITSHFVTRQIFCGAGKVGTEKPGYLPESIPYQISQRADFFEEEIGLETTLRRPIINTRDEPHCNPALYRRLHVIVGDANMSEVATYLKVGTTAVVLAMIEDNFIPHNLVLASPLEAILAVSHDPSLVTQIETVAGQHLTAIQMQYELLALAIRYRDQKGLACVEGPFGESESSNILHLWQVVLEGLESDPTKVADIVDWVAKRELINAYSRRHGPAMTLSKAKAIALQYHDMRPERCLATRLRLRTLVTHDEAVKATTEPPETTRAYFRGKCLQKWPNDVVAANWDSMVFDLGDEPLRRVPMMEPLKGTKLLVETLISSSHSVRDLIARLGNEASSDSTFLTPDVF